MQDQHRDLIQKNFSSLVERTDLDVIVAALHEKGVFSDQMIERYRDPSKDARDIKRQLYMDIVRRGPNAFGHLINTLTESGYWDLVRDLDPTSMLHPTQYSVSSKKEDFKSIPVEKEKSRTENRKSSPPPVVPRPPTPPPHLDDINVTPKFDVVKSTKFTESTDKEVIYKTRSRQRGILAVFSYTEFEGVADPRDGVDVDCINLKSLFTDMGFNALSYSNITKQATLDALASLTKEQSFRGFDCLFIVISSHGYQRRETSDTDFRCSDGQLISTYSVVEYFNNINSPHLQGIPKVFIFQLCRGDNREYAWALNPLQRPSPPATVYPVVPDTAHTDGRPMSPSSAVPNSREYLPPLKKLTLQDDGDPHSIVHTPTSAVSDILIAHSTVPGYVSYRDPMRGSWYIQALCEVFAARAHDLHVLELLTHVNRHMRERFHKQTSSIDNWGFDFKLYLHPGLYEDKSAT